MKHYHKNPRQITKKQLAQLTETLADLGDLSGIVHDLNTDEIIGGNMRSDVLNINHCEIELTHQGDAPDDQGTVAHGFIVWKGKRYAYRQVRWTPKQCERANIVANKAGGTFDFDVLANEFEVDELLTWGFETFELGIEDIEPETEAGTDTEPQIDRAEELREKWQVETGQLWQLGPHRLICGDCTDAAVVDRLMDGEKARYGMQDPPYGISVVGGSKSFGSVGGSKSFGSVVGSNIVRANKYAPIVDDDKPYDPAYILDLCPDSVLWGANYYADKLKPSKAWLVWDKKGKDWDDNFSDCELAWTPFAKLTKIYRFLWMGIVQEGPREQRMHPTQKPVGLYVDIMTELFTEPGIVLDCYLGSGTTLIACENLGRQCRAVEISPGYVAVALERYHQHTGIAPQLIA